MKEALKTIASAWAVAFIILFAAFILSPLPVNDPGKMIVRGHLDFTFFVGAVTGAGWLWYRSRERQRGKTK